MSAPKPFASCPVSVIIPVRDGEPYLAETLRSVLAQRPRPQHVIVVDDGSTDGSAELAESFGAPVEVIRQSPAGPATAVNRGVASARGEYLAWVDADDLWPDGSLSTRLSAFEDDPSLDAVFGRVSHFHSPELTAHERRSLRLPEPDQPARLRGTLLIRTASWHSVGQMDERWLVAQFVDWWARAEEAGLTDSIIDSTVLLRRLHKSNLSARHADRHGEYAQTVKAALDRRRERAKR